MHDEGLQEPARAFSSAGSFARAADLTHAFAARVKIIPESMNSKSSLISADHKAPSHIVMNAFILSYQLCRVINNHIS